MTAASGGTERMSSRHLAAAPAARAPAPTLDAERSLWRAGHRLVAGVDEVGLGALAGPVIAAAVVLPPDADWPWLAELRDSKQLTAEARARLAPLIRAGALAFGIGVASPAVVDTLNVLRASQLAMERAVSALGCQPTAALVDGNRPPALRCDTRGVIDGDASVCSIAAASIVAKVARDRLMVTFGALYPGYGFAAHKGYSAPTHLRAIHDLGVSPIHRRSFAPVRSRLTGDGHLERLLEGVAARALAAAPGAGR